MDHLESLFFFHDDGLPYFGRIIRFISMFPVDSFRKDTKVVLLGCFEGPHIFIDPEMGEFRIDESVMGFLDEDRDSGEERVSFLIGAGRMDGIKNVGEAEDNGDAERGLRDWRGLFRIEWALVVIGHQRDEGIVKSVSFGDGSGEILVRVDDFTERLIRIDS